MLQTPIRVCESIRSALSFSNRKSRATSDALGVGKIARTSGIDNRYFVTALKGLCRFWATFLRRFRWKAVVGRKCHVSDIVVKDVLDAGVHFGHRTSRWNPKMRPYIYGRRNLIHIIDIKETVRGLLRARKYLQKVAADGSLVLFCGTKRQAAEAIQESAEAAKMPYVTERGWAAR